MDDMTITLVDAKAMNQAINKVDVLLQWARMKVKPTKIKKSHTIRGKVSPKVIFIRANNSIPTSQKLREVV